MASDTDLPNGRPWTDSDTAQLRRLAAAGGNDAAIADAMGRDRPFIVRKRAALGIDRGQSASITAVIARLNMRRRLARG